jgi:S-adenosylmethionine:tRNA ribosyltransferase-isomerase
MAILGLQKRVKHCPGAAFLGRLASVRTDDYDYHLPEELIAQHPAAARDQSRLLVLTRADGAIAHRQFPDLLGYLRAGDLLVMNNSKVIPARLRAANARTGGEFELLLLEETAINDWWVMLRPGKRARPGTQMVLRDSTGHATGITATVTEFNAEGHRRLLFTGVDNILSALDALGETPLPPYIRRTAAPSAEDTERYQTVYAQPPGSAAAPTAGLHFTAALLAAARARGVGTAFVTLHVGLGTFAPVKAETLAGHVMHEERYAISAEAAQAVRETRAAGGRVIAVGTTSLRVLESVAERHHGQVTAETGRTRLFVYPPHNFLATDVLLTNFHLPKSTLLMLVSAFAAPGAEVGRALALRAYAEAVRARYRFFSYGDAMLIL